MKKNVSKLRVWSPCSFHAGGKLISPHSACFPDVGTANRRRHFDGDESLRPLALLEEARADLDRTKRDVAALQSTLANLEELKRGKAQLQELQEMVRTGMQVSNTSKRNASAIEENGNSGSGRRSKASRSEPSDAESSDVPMVRRKCHCVFLKHGLTRQ